MTNRYWWISRSNLVGERGTVCVDGCCCEWQYCIHSCCCEWPSRAIILQMIKRNRMQLTSESASSGHRTGTWGSGGHAVPGVPFFSSLAAFHHSDDGNYTVEAPQKSNQMKGMPEERHARGVCVLWTSVTARGCCPSGWYSWTMRLKKFGTQPWQSAYDV